MSPWAQIAAQRVATTPGGGETSGNGFDFSADPVMAIPEPQQYDPRRPEQVNLRRIQAVPANEFFLKLPPEMQQAYMMNPDPEMPTAPRAWTAREKAANIAAAFTRFAGQMGLNKDIAQMGEQELKRLEYERDAPTLAAMAQRANANMEEERQRKIAEAEQAQQMQRLQMAASLAPFLKDQSGVDPYVQGGEVQGLLGQFDPQRPAMQRAAEELAKFERQQAAEIANREDEQRFQEDKDREAHKYGLALGNIQMGPAWAKQRLDEWLVNEGLTKSGQTRKVAEEATAGLSNKTPGGAMILRLSQRFADDGVRYAPNIRVLYEQVWEAKKAGQPSGYTLEEEAALAKLNVGAQAMPSYSGEPFELDATVDATTFNPRLRHR
jgi:hypothetical protein